MRRVSMVLLAVLTAGVGVTGAAAPAGAAAPPICNSFTVLEYYSNPRYAAAPPSWGLDTGNWQCNLKLGAGEDFSTGLGTRWAVEELQQTINSCYPGAPNVPLTTDGKYGPRTTEAVRYVQRQIGVNDDGQAGPVTRGAMNWAFWRDGQVGVADRICRSYFI